MFKNFKNKVELHCEKFTKCLRSDWGGEYYDLTYFNNTSIVHEVTAPYTTQQNGVVETKNRVLTEIVNVMFSSSGLEHDL